MSSLSRLLLSCVLVSASQVWTTRDGRAATVSPEGLTDDTAGVAELPSLSGASGLFHTSTAGPVTGRTLRLGLRGQFFSATDFLVTGDHNLQLRRDLVFSYSPDARLELFGAWGDSSNHNRRIRRTADLDAEVVRTVGDASIGAKGWLPLASRLNVGFEVGLKLQSGASDLLWSPGATSWWLGPIVTFQAPSRLRVPFRAHVAMNYLADHSSNLSRLSEGSLDTRRVAGFAYGIGVSRLRGTVAVDIPWSAVIPSLPMTGLAFLELGWEYATANADTNFRELLPPGCGISAAAPACATRRSAERLTIGFRGAVYGALTAELGLDLVLGSPSPPYGPPLPPHNLIFGLAYPLDLAARGHHPLQGSQESRAPQGVQGAQGAREASAGSPETASHDVNGGVRHGGAAEVAPPGALATQPGPPRSSPSPPRAPAAAPAIAPHAASAGAGAPELSEPIRTQPSPPTPRPIIAGPGQHAGTMVVRGRVVDPTGRGLQAALVVRGTQQAFETVSDGQGLFEISLLPGKHVIRAQSPGFELQELQMDAVAGTETTVEVRLQPPSLDPTVQLEARAIKVGRAIHFVNGGTELTPDAQLVLKSVGEVLGVHPEISLVRIVAHWDDSVVKTAAEELTLRQAEAVRTFLLGRGIAPSRLVAAGAGAAFPLVAAPASPTSRLRNRRVEFQIVH